MNIQSTEEKQRKRGWQSSSPEESVILAENKNSWSLASNWAWGRKFSRQTSKQKFFNLHLLTKDQYLVQSVDVHIFTLPNLTWGKSLLVWGKAMMMYSENNKEQAGLSRATLEISSRISYEFVFWNMSPGFRKNENLN